MVSRVFMSVADVLQGIKRTIDNPDDPLRYRTCCHAFSAQMIARNRERLPQDGRLVILGVEGNAMHSIVVGDAGEILADTQIHWRNIASRYDPETRIYESRISPDSQEVWRYKELVSVPLRDLLHS